MAPALIGMLSLHFHFPARPVPSGVVGSPHDFQAPPALSEPRIHISPNLPHAPLYGRLDESGDGKGTVDSRFQRLACYISALQHAVRLEQSRALAASRKRQEYLQEELDKYKDCRCILREGSHRSGNIIKQPSSINDLLQDSEALRALTSMPAPLASDPRQTLPNGRMYDPAIIIDNVNIMRLKFDVEEKNQIINTANPCKITANYATEDQVNMELRRLYSSNPEDVLTAAKQAFRNKMMRPALSGTA
ncbi:hypothetical protein HGRIS_006550 [Hohenbuehelia grisea]|uniref:Uncharacterized protein n=1 Tax=Hohenbuehelia grisea TaxID=104357 RepID=A0ABR3J9U4_9AGAR